MYCDPSSIHVLFENSWMLCECSLYWNFYYTLFAVEDLNELKDSLANFRNVKESFCLPLLKSIFPNFSPTSRLPYSDSIADIQSLLRFLLGKCARRKECFPSFYPKTKYVLIFSGFQFGIICSPCSLSRIEQNWDDVIENAVVSIHQYQCAIKETTKYHEQLRLLLWAKTENVGRDFLLFI